MTIAVWDTKILAGDSLATHPENDTIAYRESKIKIIHGMAALGAGDTVKIESFFSWLEEGDFSKPFDSAAEDDFCAFVLHVDRMEVHHSGVKKPEIVSHRNSIGSDAAIHYANAIVDLGFNAISAVEKVCKYSTVCGEPIYSITQAQLKQMPKDYVGLWTGTVKSNVPKMFEDLAKSYKRR